MMVAVLLGALTLGACVDDNESQSVTDVRNAKAEQLKAAAELSKAQAEAALIQANAQKAYQEAQAEYFKAQAAVQNAMAADKEFQLQKLKDQYAAELEAINLEAQNRLLAAKIEAAKQEQAFLALANVLLQELYQTYANEVYVLDGYKAQLNQQNMLVAQYEAQVITNEQANATQKAIWENEILGYQAKIDAYKSYEGKDRSELKAEYDKLSKVADNQYMIYLNAQVTANAAHTASNKVIDAFNPYNDAATLKTVLAVKTLWQDFSFGSISSEDFVIDEELNLSVQRYSLDSEYWLENKRQELAREEKVEKDILGAKKSGETAATGYYADLEAAEKRLADATTAKDEAAINQAKLDVANWNDNIARQLKIVEEATQKIKDFEAAIASFAGEDLKAYDAALAALKEDKAVVAYIEAKKAEDKALEVYQEANAQANVTWNLYINAVDAKAEILNLENNIANCQVWIANLTNNTEQWLQQAKDEVTRLTTQIELQEAVVALAKKNLDAAIAAQEEE